MLGGPGGLDEVIEGIKGSVEAISRQVKTWYQEFLGRPAAGDEEFWVTALLNGAREEDILLNILGSPEFYDRAQTLQSSGTPDERFVESLFEELLGRTPGGEEIAAWVDQIADVGLTGVVNGFVASVEYRARMIEAYYNTLLHRPAAPVGLQAWVNSGFDLNAIRAAIEASDEFRLNG